MLSPKILRNATELLSQLTPRPPFSMMSPRDFVNADLDQLSTEGIFPEDDLRKQFLTDAREALLDPIFHGDEGVYQEFLTVYIRKISEPFQAFIEREEITALGFENINFFLYCLVCIFGVDYNPYFGKYEEGFILKAFEYLVDPVPHNTMEAPRQNRRKEGEISVDGWWFQECRKQMTYRGFFDKEGQINRNALKNELIEYSWLLVSDQKHSISMLNARYDEMSAETIKLGIDVYLNEYVKRQISDYMNYSLPPAKWFLANMYEPLEELIVRYYNTTKISRHEMRLRYLSVITETAKVKGLSIQECSLWFIASCRSIDSIKDLFYSVDRQIIQPLGILYIVSIIGEFAVDINTTSGINLAEMLREYEEKER